MCSHCFKIIYYVDGVMLRQCGGCGQIEMRLDGEWCDLQVIRTALDALKYGEPSK